MTTRIRIRWGGEWSTKGMGKGCLLPMFVTYLGVLALDLLVLAAGVSGLDTHSLSARRVQGLSEVLELDEVHARGLAIKLVADEPNHDVISLLLVDEGGRRVAQLPLGRGEVSGKFTGQRWTAYGCVLISGEIETGAHSEDFQLLLAPSGTLLGAWLTW